MTRFRSLKSLNKPRRSAAALKLIAIAATLAATTILVAPTAEADDTNWQLHGTLTQGITYTSDNNFYGDSDDDASLKFTEVSFNGSARLLPNLRASGQALYRQAGVQGERGGVDYAFLDYQFVAKSTVVAGVRAGRYKQPIGLYNETRDIAFTRPSIYVPQSVYPDRARDLELSSDGALFYTDIFTNTGQWTIELDAGRPRVDKQTIRTSFGFLPGEVDDLGQHSAFGGRLMYQSSDGQWTAALSRAEAHMHFSQALMPGFITDVDVNFTYWLASLQRNIDQWTITAEYGHMDLDLDTDVGGAALHPLQYYLQVTRHLDRHWSVYSRYDNLYWDRNDRSGDDYGALTQSSRFNNFAHDYGIGVRYDINNSAMVSAEYHYIDGTAWLSGLDNDNAAVRYWNMVAVEFSYRF